MKKLACVIALGLAAACGGDDGGGAIDAGPDAPIDAPAGACGTPVATLSTYPATHTGATVGSGRDFVVEEGACATEQGWFGAAGEDHSIALTGLTAGTTYVLELTTTQDLSMYVTTACDAAGPTAGACLLHVDESFMNESGTFVAPAGGSVFLIIDSPDDPIPTTGAYTLNVFAQECEDSTDCTTAGEPVCFNGSCVACLDAFDCTAAAAPVCDAAHACVAGAATCTGDDAGEPDDGPTAARVLAFPTAVTPTTSNAAVCSEPATERDWYRFVAPGAGSVRVAVTWTATADLDFRVYDSTGAVVEAGLSTAATSEIALAVLPAGGTYYLDIQQYDPMAAAAATPYTVTLTLPECEDLFDCTAPTRPVCEAGACVAGPAACVGDDPADGGNGDDGPAGARNLNGPVGEPQSLTGSICNTPDAEFDWYRVDVAAGAGVVIDLAWVPTTSDLDLAVFDAQSRLVGLAFWLQPEQVTLTYLPAGAYYLRVLLASAVTTTAVPYTITATHTAPQTCASRTDCAAVYSNQVYRGACTAGACQFIAPGTLADGMPCDSGDDCTSGECSYSIFESDAQDSVCTHACTTAADCTSLGAGYACTTGFTGNVCLPTCASDLECGANTNSSTIASGQPWDYFTCTVATGACSP